MIYVCTVHFGTETWIKPQLEYLNRNIKQDFRVFACVPTDRQKKDHYLEVGFEPGLKPNRSHAEKLNYLARLVSQEACSDDYLIFLDGDAFPIARMDKFVCKKLEEYRLIAVQRLENSGDNQPHPSFTATTVGFWNDLGGDWSLGGKWTNESGRLVTDPGGKLLKQLTDNGIDWYPLLRSNSHSLHPLWFGIYENLIYHHGAGFRDPVARVDHAHGRKPRAEFMESPEYEQTKLLHERVLSEILTNKRFYKDLS